MALDRIIFLSSKDPFSKKDWSGIPFFMMVAMRKYYEIEYISAPRLSLIRRLGYYVGRLYYLITGSRYIFDYGRIMAWWYGKYYTGKLQNKSDVKFVFVPAGLTEISMLQTELPIVSVGDCSTLQLFDYYPSLQKISNISRNHVESIERSALKKCSKAIFSSDWASNFVSDHFAVPTITIPFGSNISHGNGRPKLIDGSQCKLLFVGVDWVRKGGAVAVTIHSKLMERGINSMLTIVGVDAINHLPDNVKVISIDKDTDAGELEYVALLQESHFLILPTLADCTPIVIGEAFSAGTPVLATATGGISSMVQEGKTGFLFNHGDADAYCNQILDLISNPDRFAAISRNCIQASAEKFNWDQWAANLKQHCSF